MAKGEKADAKPAPSRGKRAKRKGKKKGPEPVSQQQAVQPRPQQRAAGGVPPMDAFDSLPRRRPPNSAGADEVQRADYGAEPKGDAPAPKNQAKGGKKKGQGSANAKKEPAKKSGRAAKPANPARRRRDRRIATAVLAVVLVAVGVWFSVTVLFKIEKYEVEGECRYTVDQVAGAFGHSVGDNLYGFSKENAQTRIASALPYIETIEIQRLPPSTVIFHVTPAQEAYYIPWEGGFAILSAGGKVLQLVDVEPSTLMRIDGLSCIVVELGQLLVLDEAVMKILYDEDKAADSSSLADTAGSGTGDADDEADEAPKVALTAAEIQALETPEQRAAAVTAAGLMPKESFEALWMLIEAFEAAGFERVNWVDVGDILNLQFAFEGRITVKLGSRSNVPEKLAAAYVVLTEKIESGQAGVLDLSYHTSTGKLYWRPEY